MTIAITIKVHDGVVIASDSATTLVENTNVTTVYNNANKIFHLYKSNNNIPHGLPLGIVTYGLGGIGNSSISTLIKDFRKNLSNGKIEFNPSEYTVLEVANKIKEFIYGEQYSKYFSGTENPPPLGFILAGYSSNEILAEEYRIEIINGQCKEPQLIREKELCGISWGGEGEAVHRLIKGIGMNTLYSLSQIEISEQRIIDSIKKIIDASELYLVPPPMPIKDAIDLADFLVTTTINFSRFTFGPPTVGGPVEIAAITKHEQFKWIQRKLYYDTLLNPDDYVLRI